MGGANDGGYLKPLIDNYGYAKLGFYTMRDALNDVSCFANGVNVKIGNKLVINPVFFGEIGKTYNVTANITDMNCIVLESKTYENIVCDSHIISLPEFVSKNSEAGYYGITFEIIET